MDDLISRDFIKSLGGECIAARDSKTHELFPISSIDALPSAQPEREKGEWFPDNNNYYEERFICSVCGRSYKVDTCMGKPMWDFCPCGADMRGKNSGKIT